LLFLFAIKKNISYLQVTGEEVYKSLSTYPLSRTCWLSRWAKFETKVQRLLCCLYIYKNRAMFS